MDGKQFQRTEDGHLILMSAEERDLLITDLTARINCGVICLIERVDDFGPRFRDEKLTGFCYDEIGYFYFQFGGGLDVEFAEKVKPYLRPMSSMTEKEYIEYRTIQGRNCDYGEATICVSKDFYSGIFYDGNDTIKINVYYPNPVIQDWLNKHHFDYRGLIPMGLALEAPKDMYKTHKIACDNCENNQYCSQSEYVKKNCYKL